VRRELGEEEITVAHRRRPVCPRRPVVRRRGASGVLNHVGT
jgi:hypothetical protein